MNTTRTISARTIVLFVLAAALLVVGSIGTARATLSYFSGDMVAQVQTKNIGVELMENGINVSNTNENSADAKQLLGQINEQLDKKPIQVGKAYQEELAVQNSGTIPQYVRVIVNKYWTDADGNKVTTVDPALIDLAFADDGKWVIVPTKAPDNPEQVIAYYQGIVEPGSVTEALTKSIGVNNKILSEAGTQTVQEVEGGTTIIKTEWIYNGYKMALDAEVQAVQTHNAADAINASWGVDPALVGVATQQGGE